MGLGRGSLRALDWPRNLLAQEAGHFLRGVIYPGGSTVISTVCPAAVSVILTVMRIVVSAFLNALASYPRWGIRI
jgi:hypothetical protein